MRPGCAVFFIIGLLAWPTEALACSCERGPHEPRAALSAARDDATAIFLGRADHIEEVVDDQSDFHPMPLHRVTFEVLEVFKGKVSPRQVVITHLPDGASCGYPFTPGGRFLVYAWGREPGVLGTNTCSRTRRVEEADAEVEVLRTGRMPARPVALRRERVRSCIACDLEALATDLVCAGARPCAPTPVHEIPEAVRKGQPFWTQPLTDSRAAHVYGVSAEGQAFELVRRPALLKTGCLTQVERHGCARLGLVPVGYWKRLIAECVEPTPAELVCDEAATRHSSWGPVEELPRERCGWDWLGGPYCALDMKDPPLVKDGARGARPGLLCSVGFDDMYSCRLVPDVNPRPPDILNAPSARE